MGAEAAVANSLADPIVSKFWGIKTGVYTVHDPGNYETAEFALSGRGQVLLHTGNALFVFNTVDILRVARQLATDYEKEYESK